MTATVELPAEDTLLAIHARLLEVHGGAPGLRDQGALGAALARPANLLAYGGTRDDDVPRLAVALAFSIMRNRHPFVDGNKRVAFAALLVTLELNGLTLDVAEGHAADIVQQVADGRIAEEAFAAWTAAHVSPLQAP